METVRIRLQSAREISDLATHQQVIRALLDTASGYFTKTAKKKGNASREANEDLAIVLGLQSELRRSDQSREEQIGGS